MLKYILILLLPFCGCVTQNKVLNYVEKHPKIGYDISKEHLNKYKLDAAEICLEVFPQKETIDTITIVKDSIQIEYTIDSFVQILKDTKYIDRVKIKEILKPYTTNKYITRTVYDDRYKVLFDNKDKQYAILENSYNKLRKGLFLTWAWIVLIAIGVYLYKLR